MHVTISAGPAPGQHRRPVPSAPAGRDRLPGTPDDDPDSEAVALFRRMLAATNRGDWQGAAAARRQFRRLGWSVLPLGPKGGMA